MRLLFINQYFPPDSAATGQLLGQLVESLSSDFEVSVVCGTPTYAPDLATEIKNPKIHFSRIRLLQSSRAKLFFRVWNYFVFMLGATFRAFQISKPDVVICWTDPPTVGLIGLFLKWFCGAKFIFVSQDVYPDVVLAANKLNNPISRFILSKCSRWIYAYADKIVVIGNDMQKNLEAKGVPAFKIALIRNWQDLNSLPDGQGGEFRKKNGIPENAFVVMHSGNVGYSQDFQTFISAANVLQNETDILFLIIGDGVLLSSLQNQVQNENIKNVFFFPYQPKQVLMESLQSADLQYVSLLPSFVGKIVPSKVYGIWAAGRPILGVLPTHSDSYQMIQESQSGVCVEPQAQDVVEMILKLKKDSTRLKEMGQKGRKFMEKNSSRELSVQKYSNMIFEVLKS